MNAIELTNGIWRLALSEAGNLLSLTDGTIELVRPSLELPICELVFEKTGEKRAVNSATLMRHDPTSAAFRCTVDARTPVQFQYEWEIKNPDKSGTALTCSIDLSAAASLDTDVLLNWNWNLQLPFRERKLFAPLFDGRGLRTSGMKPRDWRYECAGGWGGNHSDRLAIPLLDESSNEALLHLAYFADPFFSTGLKFSTERPHGIFACEFLHAAGPQQFQRRVFGIYAHRGDSDTALNAYFEHAISNCPPGPSWLHEVAMQDYDYLSKKGQGWYRDIDKLTELIPRKDRHRVVMTLHAWYDFLGRYCLDESTGKLIREWTAMPGGDKIPMTLKDLHKRIAYAKDRGFRVFLYFADGVAIDSGSPTYTEEIVFRERDGQLRKHHWGGPDAIAQTYVMNPVHPRVQSFFHAYLDALLQEFGKEIDGLPWDETFTTKVGDISTGEHAGYAERAFLLLCKDLRDKVKAYNPEIAFMASDCTGIRLPLEDGSYWEPAPAQNAIVFDGTYQDSHCNPLAWSYGLFPNYRNVLWSCNWKPIENFEWTHYGVRAFGAPVAISNGWADNKGISDCSEVEIRKFMDLFEFRKNLKTRVRWIETRDDA
jgi:hypothetical protein